MVVNSMTNASPFTRLFALDIQRERSQLPGKIWAFPYIAPIANLDCCIFFAYLIHGSGGAQYLPVFFIFTGIFSGALFLAYFMHDTREVLTKTHLLPITGVTRFMYAWLNTARRPALVLVYVIDALFLTSLTHDSLKHVCLALAFLFLLFVDVELLIAASLVRPGRFAARGLALTALALSFCLLEFSVFFHFDQTLIFIPVVGWAAWGMNAAASGNSVGVALAFAALVCFAVIRLIVGIRRAS
jgi:hypothetical protein